MKALFTKFIAMIMSVLMIFIPSLRPDVSEEMYKVSADTLTVNLVTNPTTGYDWRVDNSDDSILVKTLDAYSSSQSGLLGSGGVQIYEFKAVKSGSGSLVFTYQRMWEGEAIERHILFYTIDSDLNITVTEIK